MRARLTWVVLLALMVAMAGCGASSSPVAGVASTPSPSPSALVTPMGTPMPTAGQTATPGVAFVACNPSALGGAQKLGDLLVTGPSLMNLAYPSYQVPANSPLKPLKLNSASSNPFGRPADVNPNLEVGGGYGFVVCNASKTQPHTVQSVLARLAAFTPPTGQVYAWNGCEAAYDNQTGQAGGGCGGGNASDYYQMAPFAPNATVGAVVTTTDLSNSRNTPPLQSTPLPVTLAPNQAISINVGIKPPTAAGDYTFGVGLTVDGAATPFLSAAAPVLLAPVAHTWSGTACETPSMKSQIPTSPLAYYICPDS